MLKMLRLLGHSHITIIVVKCSSIEVLSQNGSVILIMRKLNPTESIEKALYYSYYSYYSCSYKYSTIEYYKLLRNYK